MGWDTSWQMSQCGGGERRDGRLEMGYAVVGDGGVVV
jgi:hypothetical protein